MKALRLPGDALTVVADFLEELLADSAAVGLSLPSEWQPGDRPAVVLADDSGPQQWPVSTISQIRVSGWASGRDDARELTGRCLGHLLGVRVPGLSSVRAGANLIDGFDKHNGGFFATATVLAKVRTKSL
ncbi:hypothetical protein [Rhodococcus pyridinivorans]|uniref:hypothetical protein n=1 Tax=Rhodococcus pyridinivorans TaxID=103816 RepID=UPI000BA21A37|nr:hypothetical protein [Rhodococcus pyridinivorans]